VCTKELGSGKWKVGSGKWEVGKLESWQVGKLESWEEIGSGLELEINEYYS
jgi:hypothetical protein